MLLEAAKSRYRRSQREGPITADVRVSEGAPGAGALRVELEIEDGPRHAPGELALDLAALRAAADDPPGYGRLLGEALFADGAIGPPFAEAVAAAEALGVPLRVRLVLDPASELQAVRWERLMLGHHGAWRALAADARLPFSRLVAPDTWERPQPPTRRPLRVLLVAASPRDLETWGLAPIPPDEVERRRAALAGPDRQVDVLASGTTRPPTLDALRVALATGYDLVHFLCHGRRLPAGSVLYLEEPSGDADAVLADRLTDAVRALSEPPAFCFLEACESARADEQGGLVALAPALVRAGGVRAVLAMSDRIQVATARQFTPQLYARLMVHGRIDVAANEARAAVRDAWDWGVPALFTALPDGQLLDFPIGAFSGEYLAHSARAYPAIASAIEHAQRSGAGDLDRALQALLGELGKSHELLVDVASRFRRTALDPAAFPAAFRAFYVEFKDRYDRETWATQDTSCQKVDALAGIVVPELASVLPPAELATLRKELGFLGSADAAAIRFFKRFLDDMNGHVEEIRAALDAKDPDRALALQRAFEAQLSPSFERSKALLAKMSRRAGHVSKA